MNTPTKIAMVLVAAICAAIALAFYTRPRQEASPRPRVLAPQSSPLDLSKPEPSFNIASSSETPPPLTVNEPAIRGWVLDSRNQPIVDAAVTIYDVAKGPRNTFSDAAGAFAVGDLDNAEYRVSAFKEHFNEAVEENVPSGSADITLILTDTSTASGRVIDHQGQPISNFDVVYVRQVIDNEPLWKEIVRGKQTVWKSFEDKEGRFEISDIASGAPFTLGARAEGYEAGYVTASAAEPGTPAVPVEIVLQTEARISGIVLSPDRAPVPAATIHFGSDTEGPVLAESDANGTFEIGGLGDSPIELTAIHDEYLAATAKAVPERGAVTPIEIVLGQGGELEGTVYQGDVPAQGQTVVALRLTPPRVRKQSTTDENGHYRIPGIGLGLVDVLAKWKAVDSKADPLRLQRQAEVVAGKTTNVDFHFPAGFAALEGTISANGEPVTFAEIQGTVTTDEGLSYFGSTAREDGYYRVENIAPGAALVAVTARAGQAELRRTFDVDLREGETARKDVAFDTASGVTGSITNLAKGETGQVLALPGHVSVDTSSFEAIIGLESLKTGESDIDANGQFVIGGLEPGPYTLVALVFSEHANTGDDALNSVRLSIQTTTVPASGEASATLTLTP
ncbi:MAG: carboxypeptidase-like regulatory domain-containing protein [Candidatus Hydrogenedentes bacterium]|nr:carboxypeptidase-like regulatory domain-containing protein [Candidatus Hydrogenedentota bacterium]